MYLTIYLKFVVSSIACAELIQHNFDLTPEATAGTPTRSHREPTFGLTDRALYGHPLWDVSFASWFPIHLCESLRISDIWICVGQLAALALIAILTRRDTRHCYA